MPARFLKTEIFTKALYKQKKPLSSFPNSHQIQIVRFNQTKLTNFKTCLYTTNIFIVKNIFFMLQFYSIRRPRLAI